MTAPHWMFRLTASYSPDWRRKWQPTPVLSPGESHGRRSLIGYSPWGCKESDMTERLHFHFHSPDVLDKHSFSIQNLSLNTYFKSVVLGYGLYSTKYIQLSVQLDKFDIYMVVTHSSVLAWRIPWTEEPGGLPSMGSQRIRHDWMTNTFTFFILLLFSCWVMSNSLQPHGPQHAILPCPSLSPKFCSMYLHWGVAQLVKNPPTMREIWVCSQGWEYPLEKGTATHFNILAWRIPWTV